MGEAGERAGHRCKIKSPHRHVGEKQTQNTPALRNTGASRSVYMRARTCCVESAGVRALHFRSTRPPGPHCATAVGAFEWVPFLVEKPCAASLSIYRYICINNICLYTMSAPGASETKHAESGSWLSPTLVASVEARNRTRLHEILFVLAIF